MVLELTRRSDPNSEVFYATLLLCGVNSLNPKAQTDEVLI